MAVHTVVYFQAWKFLFHITSHQLMYSYRWTTEAHDCLPCLAVCVCVCVCMHAVYVHMRVCVHVWVHVYETLCMAGT